MRRAGLAACGGAVSGFLVAGGGSRIAMHVIALADRSRFGFITASGATVGRMTTSGTVVGVMLAGGFLGSLSGLAYTALRPWLPRAPVRRAASFGLLVALGATAVTIEGNKDDFAFVPKVLSVSLFACVFFISGVVGAVSIDKLAPAATRPRPRAGYALIALGLAGVLALDGKALSEIFG